MSKLFKRSVALLAVLTLLFALAVPTVFAEGTEEEELPEEGEEIEELPDEDIDEGEEEVPETGDFAQAGFAAAAVVVAAGALTFTMKKARD